MNPETLTTTAEIITSIEQILSAVAQILPYTALTAAARRLPRPSKPSTSWRSHLAAVTAKAAAAAATPNKQTRAGHKKGGLVTDVSH